MLDACTALIMNCLLELQCSIVRPKVYFRIGRLLLTDLSLCFYWFKHPSKCNLSSSHCKFLKRQFALDDVETFKFAIGMQDWAASLVRVWPMKNCVLFCKDSHEIQTSSHCMFSRTLRIRIYEFFHQYWRLKKKKSLIVTKRHEGLGIAMAIRVVEFSNWGTKWESAKIWLSKSIFYVKNHPNLSHFFHWRIPI